LLNFGVIFAAGLVRNFLLFLTNLEKTVREVPCELHNCRHSNSGLRHCPRRCCPDCPSGRSDSCPIRSSYCPVTFREERRIFSRGDRIQFRAPDRALGLANGDFATIKSIDARRAVLRLDNGKGVSVASDRLRHIDHGYASTSHSAQSATVDRVIVDTDTRLSPELVNRKQFYVSISRAWHSLAIYTDDRGKLGPTVNRSREKSIAIDLSTLRHRGFAILQEQHQSISRGYGLRR